MAVKFPLTLKRKDLRLGDVIETSPNGPWTSAIVVKVTDDFVTFMRPYGVSSGTACGSPAILITYTGVETFSCWKVGSSGEQLEKVWERGEVT